ncbi:MAG: TIGR04255 family protein [Flavobacterium sp.]|jgi:uncharacterized protein (TIGR04255 family)|uniref:TIGR04255 family protein n=1 Tax=Flavobacterium sp. TaxID=239 RepID=UPI0022BC1CF4|nr:TIGR04255 family protein [Flavobacterium sp.]MCZ8091390.1 TIGR04255 family protein [Flavobacterium sp.]MCZ8332312.1 TIGR04255 family protein [Flavobacterium sp.]
MLENLKPISGSHSVNRAVITLFLPQEIIKPEKVLERINSEVHFTSKYKRRVLIKSKVLRISNEKNELSVTDKSINDSATGIILEQFDESGKIENVIILRNEDNKSIITFETRNYVRWVNFYSRFIEDFTELTKENEFYFEAISLTYIDEFIWFSDEYIPVNEIFEKNSELINSKFLKSKNGTIVLFSQNENLNIEEKTEISFNNELKRIQIIHQHATKFKSLFDIDTFKDRSEDILNVAHISNKETLKDLLSQTVKEKINLN